MQHEYIRLKTIIGQLIQTGKFQPGHLLPSEKELCSQYKLARFTVRQALDELVKDGHIIKQKGKGSIVAEKKRKPLGLFSIKGFSEAVGNDMHEAIQSKFLKPAYKIKWDDSFFYPLTDAEKKQGAFCVERIRMVVDSPVMLEYTYIPLGNIPVIKEEELINNSLFETLHDRYDIFILKAEQELIAAGASKEIANIFSVEAGTPVLHVYRRYSTNKSGCYIYSSFYCHTENFSIGNVFF